MICWFISWVCCIMVRVVNRYSLLVSSRNMIWVGDIIFVVSLI